MKTSPTSLTGIFSFLFLLIAPMADVSAQNLNDNGATHTINADNCCTGQYNELAAGQVQDYTIPAASTQNRITFTLRGGDGGFAKAGADCKSAGGEGAITTAQFAIGNYANELKPGGTIRFIVGKHGNDWSVGGSAYIAGGGGGGTAVLYRPTSSSDWIILAVAGGGGGAFQGNVFGGCVDSQRGQGGRASENGSDGAGTNHGAGGTNGNGGGSGVGGQTDVSGGGGGAFGDGGGSGSSDGGSLGYYNGGGGGVVITNSTNGSGGFGFGGGGSSFGAAGGGGGYSGGGGGGKFDNGGGGGSYVNSTYAISSTKTDGNFGEGNSEHGHVNYTFSNYEIVWTGAVNQAWNNAGNWSPSQIPQSGDKVSIPNVTNDPIISTTVSIRSLDIKENAKLEILNVGTLNINNATGVGIRVRGELKSNGAININNTGATAMYIAGSGGIAHAILYGDMNIGNINGDGIQVEDQLTIDNDPVYHYDMTPTVKIDNVSGNGISCFGCTLNIKESGAGLLAPVTMVKIGTSGTVGNIGIANAGDFNLNAGIITIGNTVSDGVVNLSINGSNYIGDFSVGNGGEMNIGSASGSVGGEGIDTRTGATFTTSGAINIQHTTENGINNQSGSIFTNSGTINIQNTTQNGILSGGTFIQNGSGSIAVDQTNSRGINAVSGSFTNSGDIKIGGIAATGGNGLVNQSTFINQSGGNIYLDLAGSWKLTQNALGSFTNNGNIEIGSVTQSSGKGIVNLGVFTNSASGTISIDRITDDGITNAGTSFSNSGSINFGENGSIGEYAILQQSGIFTNEINCTAIIRVFSGAIAGSSNFYNNGLILQESAANSTIDFNNNFFIYDAGTVTALHGNTPVYAANGISGNCFFTGCLDNTTWNNASNWYPQIPTSTQGVVVLPNRYPNIPANTTVSVKFLYLENETILSNYGTLTVSNGNFWIKNGGIAQGDGTYTINGDFINDGTFTPHTSTVILTGSGTNSFPNVYAFYNLTINKPSVNYSLLNFDLVVENNFVLSSGTFIIESNQNGSSLTTKNLTVGNGGTFIGRGTVTISGDFLIQFGGTSQGSGELHLGGNFTNLGTLEPSSGDYWLEGTTNTSLAGNQMRFNNLHINKTAGAEVILNREIEININFEMISGNVNLNGNNVQLRSNGIILNESSSSYIYGSAGVIKKTVSLNNPNNVNPGNIGVQITSNKNLGNTTIQRGHVAQNINGLTGIIRYYDVSPTTNTALNATVRFNYLDHELNANEELVLFPYRFDGTNWVKFSVNARDASANWVQTTNVASFSKWTLASCSLYFYADSDGDGYGDPSVSIQDCSAPNGYVADNTDCDDDDANAFPGQIWYRDLDNDGYYDGLAEEGCTRPTGYKLAGELVNTTDIDCDDNDASIHPGITETCNGMDDNCDGNTDEGFDLDEDGFTTCSGDCNDNDPNVNPNATEVCNGTDDNCDNQTDEGVQTTFYADTDGDGYGDPAVSTIGCTAPTGYVADNTDCDDSDDDEFPGQAWYLDGDNDGYRGWAILTGCERPTGYKTADELINTTDVDCNDGDPAVFMNQTWFQDVDNDGYHSGTFLIACNRPTGFKMASELVNTTDTDCNDGDANINPSATEVCNGADDDCNALVDDGLTFNDWYFDNDGDGYGAGSPTNACQSPGEDYVLQNGDCNDGDANINPSATEVCNGADDDCNALVDDGLPFNDWYFDNDGDGYGAGSPTNACQSPGEDYVLQNGDCNDSDSNINPSATEICDGIDNDCDDLMDAADPNYVDNTLPTITCASQATLNFNGEASFQIDGGNSPLDLQIVATDNCGIANTLISPGTISALQVGQSVPVTITVTDGKDNPASCTTIVNVTGLPAGWMATSDGTGCADGNDMAYNAATGVWTATSTDCYYASPFTTDETAFAQRTLCGNGSITALVTGISGNASGWAGVVMRESNDAGAKKAQLMTNLGQFNRREFRTETNGQSFPQQYLSQNRYWLRIVRTGNQFALYVSPNGAAWYIMGAQSIVMDNCIQMGLVLTNNSDNSTVTANFSNVSYTESNTQLASPDTPSTPQATLRQVEFDVFPNPTGGELNVNLAQYQGSSVRIEVYSVEGKLLQFREIDEVQTALESLNLSMYSSGMYLIKVKSREFPDVTKRVVLQRK